MEAAVNSIKILDQMTVKVIPEQMPSINIIPSTLWQGVNPTKAFTIKTFIENIQPGCFLQWSSQQENNCSYIDLNNLVFRNKVLQYFIFY